jgi:integrase
MQRGCLKRQTRKRGPDVWQFRWSEISLDGMRLHHKKIVGTIEQYPDENAARRVIVGLVSEINTGARPMNSSTMTVAQLCDHFAQRELAKDNSWRSHATKKIYQAYLTRWIRPHWQKYELADVRTIQVESWLCGLLLAKSSCAKIRNLMSVLFNHACRYEFFDRNPIYLVCQSAKRRTAPTILMPAEIKALINGLALRERTLVLLAASTGLRQSELFGLKWGDIDLFIRSCITAKTCKIAIERVQNVLQEQRRLVVPCQRLGVLVRVGGKLRKIDGAKNRFNLRHTAAPRMNLSASKGASSVLKKSPWPHVSRTCRSFRASPFPEDQTHGRLPA